MRGGDSVPTLQSHLASGARDVAHLEEQVRAIQEQVKQQTLLEGSTGGDTLDAELDPNSNTAHTPPLLAMMSMVR